MKVMQRELVLIEYPFSDLVGSKIRPAIIISNEEFNKKSADCIAAPLTTVIKNEPYCVNITQEDLESGELMKPSRIRIDKLFAVEKRLIFKNLGNIKLITFEKIKQEFMKLI